MRNPCSEAYEGADQNRTGACAVSGNPFARHVGNVLLTILAAFVFYLAIAGEGKTSARYAHRFPRWWYLQAVCIHRHESVDWWNRGEPYGGFQFFLSTWRRAGGRGYPNEAVPNEQYFRAWITWRRDGGSWREWSTAGMCGLA